jgi:predicted site-specific integrase-resolvase
MANTTGAIRPEDLLTAGSFTHELRIDKSTLTRWVQAGRVTPVLIDGVRFYRRVDVERLRDERSETA